jgi:SAM-dependent methyltransferase
MGSYTNIIQHFDNLAAKRGSWITKNNTYYQDLLNFYQYIISPNKNVLEIGCGTGYILANLKPNNGTGIDFSPKMIDTAKQKYRKLDLFVNNAENINKQVKKNKYDYIIISDTIGYLNDVQKVLSEIYKLSNSNTRIIINFHNYFWLPLLNLAERLGLMMPSLQSNWLNTNDILNLLNISGFSVIKHGKRFLFPFNVPFVTPLINKYVSQIPFVNNFCLTNYIIARPNILKFGPKHQPKVSVIIPARNERGNIEDAVRQIPNMGKLTEIIFVEGHSKDNTWDEIKRVQKKYQNKRLIKCYQQKGIGKADAVRLGFSKAAGDILMILDADLTVTPSDLTKFYTVIVNGKGEFINGSRLVYPLEKDSMRLLNIVGNKLFSKAFTWLLGQPIKDTLCGTKVLFADNYKKLSDNRTYFGDFDPFGDFDLLFGASKLNLQLVEVPVRYKARSYGSTQISRFKHGWLLLRMVMFAMNKIKFI